MYTSNLTELLWMLNEMQKNWVIHIELPATEEASSGESWQAQLYFLEGKVTTCQVQSSMDGRRLVTGWEAIRWLINLPHLAWKLEALTSPHASSQTFNGSQVLLPPPSWVPQRIAQAEQKVIHSW